MKEELTLEENDCIGSILSNACSCYKIISGAIILLQCEFFLHVTKSLGVQLDPGYLRTTMIQSCLAPTR